MGRKALTESSAEATLSAARNHLNGPRICYTNARALLDMGSKLGVQRDSIMLDEIEVTETLLTQYVDSIELDLESLTLARDDRILKLSRGVAHFIRNIIPSTFTDSVSREGGT